MKAVDIFSLGVVLYDTISGGKQRLFYGSDFNELLFNNEHFTGLNEFHQHYIRSVIGDAYMNLLDSILQLQQCNRSIFKVIETEFAQCNPKMFQPKGRNRQEDNIEFQG